MELAILEVNLTLEKKFYRRNDRFFSVANLEFEEGSWIPFVGVSYHC